MSSHQAHMGNSSSHQHLPKASHLHSLRVRPLPRRAAWQPMQPPAAHEGPARPRQQPSDDDPELQMALALSYAGAAAELATTSEDSDVLLAAQALLGTYFQVQVHPPPALLPAPMRRTHVFEVILHARPQTLVYPSPTWREPLT